MSNDLSLEKMAYLLDLQESVGAQRVAQGIQLTYKKIPLEGIMMVGTDALADIIVDRDYVSPSHAVIKEEEGDYMLTDLGSRQGTYVRRTLEDGRDITSRLEPKKPFALKQKDYVIFGNPENGGYRFKFEVPQEMHRLMTELKVMKFDGPKLMKKRKVAALYPIVDTGIGARQIAGSGFVNQELERGYPLLSGRFVIGSGNDCEIRADGSCIRERHVAIEKRERGYFVVPYPNAIVKILTPHEIMGPLVAEKPYELGKLDTLIIGEGKNELVYRLGFMEVEE